MAVMRRGIQDIRTYAGRATAPGSNHKKYVRLSTLELERTRRQHEYDTAQARADIAKERVAKLEAEIAEIMGAVAGPSDGVPPPPAAGRGLDPGRVSVKHTYGVSRASVVLGMATERESGG